MVSPGSKWSTRYGAQYRRLCARPGCSAPAVATLRFQSTERLAWLVELDDNSVRTQGDLCSRHAAALVLPRGWELYDERVPRPAPPAAATEPAAERTAAVPGARRARKRTKPAREPDHASQLPGLEPAGEPPAAPAGVAAEVAVEREVAVEPEVAVAVEAEPGDAAVSSAPRGVPAQFGTSEDTEVIDDALDEILDARTPLLRRAFRNAKPN